MQTFFLCVKRTSIVLGGIIGAGFISGKELILFFGQEGWLVNCTFSAIVTFILLWFSFSFASVKPKDKDLVLLSYHNPKFVRFTWLFFYFVVMVVLLGSIDDILPIKLFGIKLPIASSITLILARVVVGKDRVKVLSKINSFLMIAVVVFLVVCTTSEGVTINFENAVEPLGLKGVLSSSTYAFFNVFLCFYPIVNQCENIYKKQKKKSLVNLFACIISSVIIYLLSILIVAVIYQTNSQCSALPLIYAFGGRKTTILKVAMLCGIFTSLTTVVYSISNQFVCNESKSKGNKFIKVGIYVVAIVFSLINVDKVIGIGYYTAGGFGLLVFVGFVRYFFYYGIKGQTKTDNNCKLQKEITMSRKKKNKVAKLTEEEYNNYLMAMKDSKPPELIIKNQKQ